MMTSKERYIQQLTQDLYCRNIDTPDECNDMAEIIADEVYGKIKQALYGFADLIKSQMREQAYGIDLKGAIFYEQDIDNLLKEFLKNE